MKKLLLDLTSIFISVLVVLLKVKTLLIIISMFDITFLNKITFYQAFGIVSLIAVFRVNKKEVLKLIKNFEKHKTKDEKKDFIQEIKVYLYSSIIYLTILLFCYLISIVLK